MPGRSHYQDPQRPVLPGRLVHRVREKSHLPDGVVPLRRQVSVHHRRHFAARVLDGGSGKAELLIINHLVIMFSPTLAHWLVMGWESVFVVPV